MLDADIRSATVELLERLGRQHLLESAPRSVSSVAGLVLFGFVLGLFALLLAGLLVASRY